MRLFLTIEKWFEEKEAAQRLRNFLTLETRAAETRDLRFFHSNNSGTKLLNMNQILILSYSLLFFLFEVLQVISNLISSFFADNNIFNS